jgi:hypothetical protein
MVRWGNSNGGVQQFHAFQTISLTEVRVKIHECDKVGMWTSILVLKGHVAEGARKYGEFVLQCCVLREES